MFKLRNLPHFRKSKLGETKPVLYSLFLGIGILSISVVPSIAMERPLTRSNRHFLTNEAPMKQINLNIYKILEKQSSPIALQT